MIIIDCEKATPREIVEAVAQFLERQLKAELDASPTILDLKTERERGAFIGAKSAFEQICKMLRSEVIYANEPPEQTPPDEARKLDGLKQVPNLIH